MPAKRKSAFNAATATTRPSYTQVMKEAQQHGETVEPLEGEAVKPLHSETVRPLEGETATQQSGETVEQLYRVTEEQLYSDTVIQQGSSTVAPFHRLTVKKEEKISFYLTHEQASKLDDLAHEHRKRTGKRINRNDIVRHLIDQCDIDTLANMPA